MTADKQKPRFPLEWVEDGVVVLSAKKDPAQKPLLYACPKCGAVNSPSIYLAKPDDAHAAARRGARECYNCMPDRECKDCGESTGSKSRLVCDDCHKNRVLSKAKQVPASELDECFGWSDAFYLSPEDALDAGESLVFASTFRPFHLNADNIIDQALDDHFEDASPDDLSGLSDLTRAIEAFNTCQKSGSYDVDRSRYALLEAESETAS